jgi:hypothetical protein
VFEYKAEVMRDDGTTEKVVLSFKDIGLLPIGVLMDNRYDRVAEMWDTLTWGVGDQLDVLKQIPQKDLQPMMEAWRDAEGVGVPESGASSASSTDTVRHSKQTSLETGSD